MGLGLPWGKKRPPKKSNADDSGPEPRPLRLFTCTWNVGNKAPNASVDFLHNAREYDLVIIGLQEATFTVTNKARRAARSPGELSPTPPVGMCSNNTIINKGGHLGIGAGIGSIVGGVFFFPMPLVGAALGAAVGAAAADYGGKEYQSRTYMADLIKSKLGNKFELLGSDALLQMRLFILVRSELASAVKNVQVKSEATGFGNMVGNKGGLAATMRIWGTRLCVVASHLAAHQENCKDRNEDVRLILRGIRFGNKELDFHMSNDHTIWMGDLNYRLDMFEVDEAQNFQKSISLIQKQNWQELLQRDQLRSHMESGEVFANFQEGEISFAPTFKLVREKDYQKAVAKEQAKGAAASIGSIDDAEAPEDHAEASGSKSRMELLEEEPGSRRTSAHDGEQEEEPGGSGPQEKKRRSLLGRAQHKIVKTIMGSGLGSSTSKQSSVIRNVAQAINNLQEEPVGDVVEESTKCATVELHGGVRVRYAKKRFPSYTDRILFHSLPGRAQELRQTAYGSFPETSSSDHAPVWAGFVLEPTWNNTAAADSNRETVHVSFEEVAVILTDEKFHPESTRGTISGLPSPTRSRRTSAMSVEAQGTSFNDERPRGFHAPSQPLSPILATPKSTLSKNEHPPTPSTRPLSEGGHTFIGSDADLSAPPSPASPASRSQDSPASSRHGEGTRIVSQAVGRKPNVHMWTSMQGATEEVTRYMLVTYSNETSTAERTRARFFSNNVEAAREQMALHINFASTDLPEVPLAPALQCAGGIVPRHIQLSVMAHTRSLGDRSHMNPSTAAKGFFPSPRSQSYVPGQMSMSGVHIVGQGTVTVDTAGDQRELQQNKHKASALHTFSVPLCKYSHQIGTVSGKYTISYSHAGETSRSFRHASR